MKAIMLNKNNILLPVIKIYLAWADFKSSSQHAIIGGVTWKKVPDDSVMAELVCLQLRLHIQKCTALSQLMQ